jgi:sec-independent protein translocase protein TatA
MDSLAFIGRVGSGELLLILLVFIVLFGARRIPELARSLGKGIREFKNATRELAEELDDQPKEKKDGQLE